jgi:cytochrome c553
MASYRAAQSKSNQKMLDAADVVTTCSNCHDRYRDKPAGVADRCK